MVKPYAVLPLQLLCQGENRELRLEVVTFQEEIVGMMVDALAPERGLFSMTSKGLNAVRAGEPNEVQAAENALISPRSRGCRGPGNSRPGIHFPRRHVPGPEKAEISPPHGRVNLEGPPVARR